MRANLQKWGNSLGLRIPIQIAKQLKWHEGSVVSFEIDNGRIIIQSPKYDLKKMLEEITPENLPNQIREDEKKGIEEW